MKASSDGNFPAHPLYPRIDLGVGGSNLPCPALLHQQLVGHDLVEDAAQDLIALPGRHRPSVARLECRDCSIEFRLADAFAVDAGDDVWDLRGDRLGRWCASVAPAGGGEPACGVAGAAAALADAAGVLEHALTRMRASSVSVRIKSSP